MNILSFAKILSAFVYSFLTQDLFYYSFTTFFTHVFLLFIVFVSSAFDWLVIINDFFLPCIFRVSHLRGVSISLRELYLSLRNIEKRILDSCQVWETHFSSVPTFSLGYSFISLMFFCTQSSMKLHLFTPEYWSYHYWGWQLFSKTEQVCSIKWKRRKSSQLLLLFHMIQAETWESSLNIDLAYHSCVTARSSDRFTKLHVILSKKAKVFLKLKGA